jgi:hypothetical protein
MARSHVVPPHRAAAYAATSCSHIAQVRHAQRYRVHCAAGPVSTGQSPVPGKPDAPAVPPNAVPSHPCQLAGRRACAAVRISRHRSDGRRHAVSKVIRQAYCLGKPRRHCGGER